MPHHAERACPAVVPTALSSGAQKLGQPVWLSNLVVEENRARSQPGAGEGAAPLLVEQRAREGALGGLAPQHRILVGLQQLAPFRVGVRDLEGLGSASRGRSPR